MTISHEDKSELGIERLVSRRASGRFFKHFSSVSLEDAPKDFKPHPEPLSLSFGKPNAQFFPIKGITIDTYDYPFQGSIFNKENSDFQVKIGRKSTDVAPGIEEAFQYGETAGLKTFHEFVKQFVKRVHLPKFEDWDVTLTNGSGDGIYKAIDSVIDEGDIILVEEFTFTPVTNAVKSVGGHVVPVKFNVKDGKRDLDLGYFANILENWDSIYPEFSGKKPKAFYTIPTAQNPYGLTQTTQTRQKVYDLAKKYDFVIIEDDPYGYLSFPPLRDPDTNTLEEDDIATDEFVDNYLVPSYLKFDTDGRVIRLETFSKVFAPGLRLGFVVGHSAFIKSIQTFATVSTRAPSGVSQLVLANIIQQKFNGLNGYIEWILKMRLAYTHRRNVLISSILNSVAHKKGYVSILSGDSGMFAAVSVNFPEGTSVVPTMDLLNYKFLQYGVQVILGTKMAIDSDFSSDRANFLRLSYAPADSDDELKEAASRLVKAIADFFDKGLKY